MTKIETRLSVGDECFYLHENKVVKSEVEAISINIYESRGEVVIHTNYDCPEIIEIDEKDIFPTKQALLDSL